MQEKRREQERSNKMSSEHRHLLQEEEKAKEKAKEERRERRKNHMTNARGASPIVSTPNHLLWTMWHQTTSQLENPNCNKNLVTANTVVSLLVTFGVARRAQAYC
jgi:hypothetical protein